MKKNYLSTLLVQSIISQHLFVCVFGFILICTSLTVSAQTALDENVDAGSMPTGITYQNGPGTSNSKNWTYPFGVKLSVWGNFTRNFEIMNTNKTSSSTLAFRTYDQNASSWTPWREFIFKNSSGKVGIGMTSPTVELDINGRVRSAASGEINPLFLMAYEDVNKFQLGYNSAEDIFRIDSRINSGTWLTRVSVNKETGDVGIGTINPSAKLDVIGNVHMSGGLIQFNRSYENFGNVLVLKTKDNNQYGDFRFEAERTDDNSLRKLMFLDGGRGALGIGTETIPDGFKLAVDGKGIFEEVKVQLSEQWPDYVFQSSYKLRTLKETKIFINENKHLPEIPSAKEVEANGVELGDMNIRLLKKIEELTLYMIEFDRRMELIEEENRALKKENQELKSKFSALRKEK